MFYKYTRLIKCTRCGKNYRGIKDRNQISYICSGYANYGGNYCTRGKITEEEIDFIVERHKSSQVVKAIYVKENADLEIIYDDNTKSIYTSEKIIF